MNSLFAPMGKLPEIFAEGLKKNLQTFEERCPEYVQWLSGLLEDAAFRGEFIKVWACSEFVVKLCLRRPEIFRALIDNNGHRETLSENAMAESLALAPQGIDDANALNKALREFRAYHQLRIIWRDLNALADLLETTRDISSLAQSTIRAALAFHYSALCESMGRPMAMVDGALVEQEMLVIGMGKLGAYELNLSSDVDLIFAFPDNGETVGVAKPVDNQLFFARLGQRLIHAVDQQTADGFVFRVDMRLRPYGDSGALVMSFDALEEYYQDQGRDWERYALIKARIVAGSQRQSDRLMKLLRPFTYRRYLDYSAIESLRSMKSMIAKEVKRRGLGSDVKLGSGGIREIEFIAQSFQLIRGGRDVELQERRVLLVLELLREKHYLPGNACDELIAAYIFLRDSEHAIQAYEDRQTQSLPEQDLPRAALALAMGFEDWSSYTEALAIHRGHVSEHFTHLIAEPEGEEETVVVDEHWLDFWYHCDDEAVDEQESLDQLVAAGHRDAPLVLEKLRQLKAGNTVTKMQAIGRERLEHFMPMLLQAVVVDVEDSSAALLRILPLVEAVLRRTSYLLLLIENPPALEKLVVLCEVSPWIASQLARHPVLLDELLDAETLFTAPKKDVLRDELKQQLLRFGWDDLEAHMDGMRYFKLAHVLRVVASEVAGCLALMKVSDYLTVIAEVILEHVLELVWHNLSEKYGQPVNAEGEACDKDFIIVAYGKLGGIELSYGSDLDLVFIHDAAPNTMTNGDRPIDNSVFYTRLGQRMIHILSAQTMLGPLYEVDMRLRPSGDSGLLVSSLKSYQQYQMQDAWTWEHQALVRARVVAGDLVLGRRFAKVRAGILCQPRDEQALRQEVREMREKMREHLEPKALNEEEKPLFHLKHSAGAIVDIEFMVQYSVLAWANLHPALVEYTDNIRILEALYREGLFSESESEDLTVAYKALRASTHRLSLQQQPNTALMSAYADYRQIVVAKWQQLIEVE